jgi:hypothetical protein
MARESKDLREALAAGVIACWGSLTSDSQQQIFEASLETSSDPSLREALAIFLHDRHPRTEEEAGKRAGARGVPRSV